MMRKVIWPEGLPDEAISTESRILDFAMSLVWSLRLRRTCRAWPVKRGEYPPTVARKCEGMKR